MKLLSSRNNRAPALRLRRIVDQEGGSSTIVVSQMMWSMGHESPTASAVDKVERQLSAVGLRTVPALATCAWDEQIVVTSEPQGAATAPVEAAPAAEAYDIAPLEPNLEADPEPAAEPAETEIEEQSIEPVEDSSPADGGVMEVQQNGSPEQLTDGRPSESRIEQRLHALVDEERRASAEKAREAERRIAEASEVIAEARAESERERASRGELEQTLA
jgi:hypothetical protein